MAISVNYASPVTVNGFSCRNCSEVAQAQRHIDPAHPKSGPFGVTAGSDPTATAEAKKKAHAEPTSSLTDRPPAYGAGGKPRGAQPVGSMIDLSA